MANIIKVNDKSIRVLCDNGHQYNHKTDNFEPVFLEEFQQYESLQTVCPECNLITIFNMNIPESEFDEDEIDQEPFFPPGEKEAREKVRAVMWQQRKDLKGKDRAQHDKDKKDQLEKKYMLPLETIKDQAKRAARLAKGLKK